MLSFHKTLKSHKKTPQSSPRFVHPDELSYQNNKKKLRFFCIKKNNGTDGHVQQPLLDEIKGNGAHEIKAVNQPQGRHQIKATKDVNLRVKIRMTKEEAERLMAKCKDQRGTLGFRDVAVELGKIPANRIVEVNTMASKTTTPCRRPRQVLPTIQE